MIVYSDPTSIESTELIWSDDFLVEGPAAPEWLTISNPGTNYSNTSGVMYMSANTTGSSRKFVGIDESISQGGPIKLITRTNDSGGLAGVFIRGSGTSYSDFTGYEVQTASGYANLYRWVDGVRGDSIFRSSWAAANEYRTIGISFEPDTGNGAWIRAYRYGLGTPEGPPGTEVLLFELEDVSPLPAGLVGMSHNVSTSGNFTSDYALVYGSASDPLLTAVNGGQPIKTGDVINFSGRNLESATTASLGGFSLVISSVTDTEVICDPIDLHDTQLDYGATTATLDITAPIDTSVTTNNLYVVGTDIDATNGLAEDGGAAGDTWEVTSTVQSSSITLEPDTNIVLDPAVKNGTVVPFWRKTPGANDWVESQVTVNGGPGPVGDRDTTSTPYKASEDGLVYFRYPNGDAP